MLYSNNKIVFSEEKSAHSRKKDVEWNGRFVEKKEISIPFFSHGFWSNVLRIDASNKLVNWITMPNNKNGYGIIETNIVQS